MGNEVTLCLQCTTKNFSAGPRLFVGAYANTGLGVTFIESMHE